MDWGQLQSIAFAVMAVTTIVAAAIVGALVGTNKTLRETVSDRGVRNDDLEKSEARLKAELAERASENNILKSMVTGKVELIALGDLLDEHHREALKSWGLIGADVKAMPAAIVKAMKQEKP